MYTAMATYIYEPATPIMTSCMVAKSIMFTKYCVKKLMLCALYVHKSIHLKLKNLQMLPHKCSHHRITRYCTSYTIQYCSGIDPYTYAVNKFFFYKAFVHIK